MLSTYISKNTYKDLEDEWAAGYLKLINEFYENPFILTTSIITNYKMSY